MTSASKPRLLVVSHVLPFPRSAGQRQRVYYTLKAARRRFHVTFAVVGVPGEKGKLQNELADVCDESILLPSCYARSLLLKIWHRVVAAGYCLKTGLKFSNYLIGEVELTRERIMGLFEGRNFDCALFEYWHAWRAATALKSLGVPTIVDTHNVLWQAYRRDLSAESRMPRWWQGRAVAKYRECEERAWAAFDGVIAINREEFDAIRCKTPSAANVFYTPMGIDLLEWPYSWQPDGAIRLAYYGGLGSPHNQRDALECAEQVMPEVWQHYPNAELWLVGSNPPDKLRALTSDPRIRVTGFVDNVQKVLRQMAVVLCPWTGTYGFRSRLVEVLALGVPVVASPDAIVGMEFVDGESISLALDAESMAQQSVRLLGNLKLAQRQSHAGRLAIEQHYDNVNTYDRLVDELCVWLQARKESPIGIQQADRSLVDAPEPTLGFSNDVH